MSDVRLVEMGSGMREWNAGPGQTYETLHLVYDVVFFCFIYNM